MKNQLRKDKDKDPYSNIKFIKKQSNNTITLITQRLMIDLERSV